MGQSSMRQGNSMQKTLKSSESRIIKEQGDVGKRKRFTKLGNVKEKSAREGEA